MHTFQTLPIGHVQYQYPNMVPWLSGQNCNFIKFLCLNSQRRLEYKENNTKYLIEVCPKSLRATLEYWYIERGLLLRVSKQ